MGTVVMLFDETGEIEWNEAGLATYEGRNYDGADTEWVMMHQACFAKLLEEIYKSERQVAFSLIIGDVPVVREALGM